MEYLKANNAKKKLSWLHLGLLQDLAAAYQTTILRRARFWPALAPAKTALWLRLKSPALTEGLTPLIPKKGNVFTSFLVIAETAYAPFIGVKR